MASFEMPPRRIFVVHGEPPAAESLAHAIRERWTTVEVTVAQDGSEVPL
jgi:predicted metal-dependent RNase